MIDPRGSTGLSGACPPSPDLSVIVVSWNTRELLARCLASVSRAASKADGVETPRECPVIEVLVVDNASSDGSAAMVRDLFPRARVIANVENVGFARANNQAMRLSAGRYILLLNPDTEAHPGALDALVRFMDEHPRAGAAGGRMVEGGGQLYVSCYPEPTLFRELWRLFHMERILPLSAYPMEQWDPHTPRQVDAAQGACLILRREALDQVGRLDEDYFIYSEEVDLCHRLRTHGWQVWWVPEAMVTHWGGQSTRQAARAMFLRLYQAKVLYFRKNYGNRSARAYKLIVLAAALARLLLSPLAWALPHRARHVALAGHYSQLVRALPGY